MHYYLVRDEKKKKKTEDKKYTFSFKMGLGFLFYFTLTFLGIVIFLVCILISSYMEEVCRCSQTSYKVGILQVPLQTYVSSFFFLVLVLFVLFSLLPHPSRLQQQMKRWELQLLTATVSVSFSFSFSIICLVNYHIQYN